MRIWPEKRNGIQGRLVAIRSDVETLGDDVRGLADDIASYAGTQAGQAIAPVAKRLNAISSQLNGGPWSIRSPEMRQLAVIALAMAGGAAVIAGIAARR